MPYCQSIRDQIWYPNDTFEDMCKIHNFDTSSLITPDLLFFFYIWQHTQFPKLTSKIVQKSDQSIAAFLNKVKNKTLLTLILEYLVIENLFQKYTFTKNYAPMLARAITAKSRMSNFQYIKILTKRRKTDKCNCYWPCQRNSDVSIWRGELGSWISEKAAKSKPGGESKLWIKRRYKLWD